ncbi:MAG TPA: BlaI/MecI/CopY family transcriptional regulator [Vicinamibacterales bacterium]|nr:BlaI/MecI/CopY family transcriptional regulator [Vicinamibacterales bacterium]
MSADRSPDKPTQPGLSRRERQIMDILYRRGRATGGEVMEDLPGTPSYSTVRTQLRVLERKGHVRHEEHGLKFIYMPAVPRRAARKSALKHLVETFFDGSVEKVVGALLGGEGVRVSDEELDRIAEQVARARSPKKGEPR